MENITELKAIRCADKFSNLLDGDEDENIKSLIHTSMQIGYRHGAEEDRFVALEAFCMVKCGHSKLHCTRVIEDGCEAFNQYKRQMKIIHKRSLDY